MGLTYDCTRFMLAAREGGVSFGRMLTLGRQWCRLDRSKMKTLWSRRGYPGIEHVADEGAWADDIFKALGADRLEVTDYSPYEGADVIHDLNLPVPSTHHDAYDVVFDGGVLEHVFNYPMAVENCMRMVREGGHVIIASIANNELGHGFYQFSPELFFRLFSKANGYRVRSMVLVEAKLFGSSWYHVMDAAALGARVCCISHSPLHILVLAQRIGPVPEHLDVQQADYVQAWDEVKRTEKPEAEVRLVEKATLKQRVVNSMPMRWRRRLEHIYRYCWVTRLYNRRFFRRIHKDRFTI